MVQFRIVVAKYKEDMAWTSTLPCIIYNKDSSNEDSRFITLENIGREAHTYLHHIVSNYDNLDDYTVFVQGHPFDHSPRLLEKIRYISFLDELPDFIHLSEFILPTSTHEDPYHQALPMKEVYTYLFGEPSSRKNFCFGAGAQFLVSRKLIQHIPKETYEKLLKYSVEGWGPYLLERFWEQIFMSGIDGIPQLNIST